MRGRPALRDQVMARSAFVRLAQPIADLHLLGIRRVRRQNARLAFNSLGRRHLRVRTGVKPGAMPSRRPYAWERAQGRRAAQPLSHPDRALRYHAQMGDGQPVVPTTYPMVRRADPVRLGERCARTTQGAPWASLPPVSAHRLSTPAGRGTGGRTRAWPAGHAWRTEAAANMGVAKGDA